VRHDAAATAAVYVGAVVGAGFGSGREILQFFSVYGGAGLWGCLMAGAAFGWLGARVLQLAAEGRAPDYRRLYAVALGERLATPAEWVSSAALLVGLAAVLAGAGALAADVYGWPPLCGELLMAAAIAAVLAPGRRGLIGGSLALVPPLVAAAVGLFAVEARQGHVGWSLAAVGGPAARHPGAWLLGAVLYVGYNVMLAAVTLCAAGRGRPVRGARAGGLLGGVLLGVLAALVHSVLLAHLGEVADAPLPLGRVVAAYGPAWLAAYSACLGLALLTTGIATAFTLADRFGPRRLPVGVAAAAVVLAALPLAGRGLVTLVATAYPVMGALGLLLCVGLVGRGRR
jgi:uncharacterized membrane protein YkvI